MEKAEDQGCRLSVRLYTEPALVGAEVVERLVNDGQTNNGVNQVGIDAPAEIDAREHRRRMPDREQADIDGDVFHLVEEEDDAEEEQQVIVSGDHMLGAEIGEGDQVYAADLHNVALVAFCDGMCQGRCTADKDRQTAQGEDNEERPPQTGRIPRRVKSGVSHWMVSTLFDCRMKAPVWRGFIRVEAYPDRRREPTMCG